MQIAVPCKHLHKHPRSRGGQLSADLVARCGTLLLMFRSGGRGSGWAYAAAARVLSAPLRTSVDASGGWCGNTCVRCVMMSHAGGSTALWCVYTVRAVELSSYASFNSGCCGLGVGGSQERPASQRSAGTFSTGLI